MPEPTRATQHTHDPGPTLHRRVAAPAEVVWEVLADGWSYASWVVGTARIRAVDPDWPEIGSRIHHSVGLWPLLLQDFTKVEKSTPTTDLVLLARGWPVGEARVHLSVAPQAQGGCTITMTEDAVRGPGRLVPRLWRWLVLRPRNRESLHRLAMMAEGKHRGTGEVTP